MGPGAEQRSPLAPFCPSLFRPLDPLAADIAQRWARLPWRRRVGCVSRETGVVLSRDERCGGCGWPTPLDGRRFRRSLRSTAVRTRAREHRPRVPRRGLREPKIHVKRVREAPSVVRNAVLSEVRPCSPFTSGGPLTWAARTVMSPPPSRGRATAMRREPTRRARSSGRGERVSRETSAICLLYTSDAADE